MGDPPMVRVLTHVGRSPTKQSRSDPLDHKEEIAPRLLLAA